MSESEAKPDLNVDQKVADVPDAQGKEIEAVENTACCSTDSSAMKPEISKVEPPSELEQKIIKQIEVSSYDLVIR